MSSSLRVRFVFFFCDLGGASSLDGGSCFAFLREKRLLNCVRISDLGLE